MAAPGPSPPPRPADLRPLVDAYAAMIPIDDPDDPRIAVFREIRERDLAGRDGLIAEGAVVLDQLLASRRFRPTALMILRRRLAGLEARLARVPADVPVYVADDAVLDRIAGFPVHRGILAHGERRHGLPPAAETLAAVAGRRGIVVVAAGIANHDNMGGLFRNAAAFGAGAVIVDAASCDPLYRKAIRVSVGTVLTVPFFRARSAEEALGDLTALGFEALALSPSGTTAVQDFNRIAPAALFLGSEGAGLAPALIRRMESLRIDMAEGLDSLNVAVSAAIVLHRLTTLRRAR